MNVFTRWIVVAALAIAGTCAGAWAQAVNDLPRKEDPLSTQMVAFDVLVRGNHWNEGTVMPDVIFPPAGKDAPIVGKQDGSAMATGLYLAALSFRYATASEPGVRAWADTTMDGLLKLEKVTGVPGCVARSFNKAEAPNWHEYAFSSPMEWHESVSMPGYRWMGGFGVAPLTGVMFGVTAYWELCADDAHKAVAADFIDDVMGRCVQHDLKIVDANDKTPPGGNCCPDLPHEPLHALLVLAHLKAASHITGKPVFDAAYRRLIAKYKYDDEAVQAKALWPAEYRDEASDTLAAMAYYTLLRFEDDAGLLEKYRAGLGRHWAAWKEGDNPFLKTVYQALTHENAMDEKATARLRAMGTVAREHGTWDVALPDGPKSFDGDHETFDPWALPAYWFGRHVGAVDPQW